MSSLAAGPFRYVEFPFRSPTDDTGSLDLAVATPTGFEIAEIKPSTQSGEQAGIQDLEWYRMQLQATYPDRDIGLLRVSIPSATLFMPDPVAQAGGCVVQRLAVMLMRPGLFGYYCSPPYSLARRTCRCGRTDAPPVPVPFPAPVPADERTEEREKLRSDPRLAPALAAAGAAAATAAVVARRALWRHFWQAVVRRFAIRGAAAAAMSLADGPLPFGELASLGLGIFTIAQIAMDWNELWQQAEAIAASEGA
jgi:hypothetical protein